MTDPESHDGVDDVGRPGRLQAQQRVARVGAEVARRRRVRVRRGVRRAALHQEAVLPPVHRLALLHRAEHRLVYLKRFWTFGQLCAVCLEIKKTNIIKNN